MFWIILLFLALLSMGLAWRSLKELDIPVEVKQILRDSSTNRREKLWGIVLFAGDRVIHYTSSSNGSSEDNPSSEGDNNSDRT